MDLIIAGKGQGKTTELIKMSAKDMIPIIVINDQEKQYTADLARAGGFEIPEPIIFSDLPRYIEEGGLDGDILIDDIDKLLLNMGVSIKCSTMTSPSTIYTHSEFME